MLLTNRQRSAPARQPNKQGSKPPGKLCTRAELARIRSFASVPEAQSTAYTLCELDDEGMKKLLEGAECLSKCSERTGWYKEETLVELRKLMKAKLKQLVEIGVEGTAGEHVVGDELEEELDEEDNDNEDSEEDPQEEEEEEEELNEARALVLLNAYAPTAGMVYDDDGGDEFDILDDNSD